MSGSTLEATTDSAVVDGPAPTEESTALSFEQLSDLLILQKLQQVRSAFKSKAEELRQQQEQLRWTHELMQRINKHVDQGTGELNLLHPMIDPKTGESIEGADLEDATLQEILNLREMMREAVDTHNYPIKIQDVYNREERVALMDSLRTTCEDLGLQNDMQTLDLNQLTNEHYEVYQMARAITKPVHEDKVHKARAVSGR